MQRLASGLLLAAALGICAPLAAYAENAVLVTPDQMKWAPVDGIPGAQLTVVSGDASKTGPFVMELRWPEGSNIGPHWHSNTERITIMSGTGMVGMGDTLDRQKGTLMPAGTYAEMPAKMHHWFVAQTPVLMLLEGQGPFDVNLVRPEDASTKKTQ